MSFIGLTLYALEPGPWGRQNIHGEEAKRPSGNEAIRTSAASRKLGDANPSFGLQVSGNKPNMRATTTCTNINIIVSLLSLFFFLFL
ncbi:hypothetical protein V8F33_010203 [Rhypophila sp. PSN 637]